MVFAVIEFALLLRLIFASLIIGSYVAQLAGDRSHVVQVLVRSEFDQLFLELGDMHLPLEGGFLAQRQVSLLGCHDMRHLAILLHDLVINLLVLLNDEQYLLVKVSVSRANELKLALDAVIVLLIIHDMGAVLEVGTIRVTLLALWFISDNGESAALFALVGMIFPKLKSVMLSKSLIHGRRSNELRSFKSGKQLLLIVDGNLLVRARLLDVQDVGRKLLYLLGVVVASERQVLVEQSYLEPLDLSVLLEVDTVINLPLHEGLKGW